MKLHLLEELIDQFISEQILVDSIDWYFPHALVSHFHQWWRTPEPMTIKETYSQCLKSEYSQRWWKRDNYKPKEIMLDLIDADPELATIAWKDLANDSATLDGRLYRFNYYGEELLQMHRSKHDRSVETYHHQDASIVSLYLAGLFPSKYSLYPGLDSFKTYCKNVGSPDTPIIDDLVRYMKVASICFTFLQRNKNYEKLVAMRSPGKHNVVFVPLVLSYELMIFGEQKFKSKTA